MESRFRILTFFILILLPISVHANSSSCTSETRLSESVAMIMSALQEYDYLDMAAQMHGTLKPVAENYARSFFTNGLDFEEKVHDLRDLLSEGLHRFAQQYGKEVSCRAHDFGSSSLGLSCLTLFNSEIFEFHVFAEISALTSYQLDLDTGKMRREESQIDLIVELSSKVGRVLINLPAPMTAKIEALYEEFGGQVFHVGPQVSQVSFPIGEEIVGTFAAEEYLRLFSVLSATNSSSSYCGETTDF